MSSLHVCKLLMLRACRSLGGFELCLRSSWRQSRVAFLCFHGISLKDEHQWEPGLYISPQLFRARMERLRRLRCTVLPLAEALERVRANSLPPRSVVITFDDGFYDYLALAHPILREFGYPATLYLTTFDSQYNVPVFHLMCSYLLWATHGRNVRVTGFDGKPFALNAATPKGRQDALGWIQHQVDAAQPSVADKQTWLASFAHSLGVDLDGLCRARVLHPLQHEEIRLLAEEGTDIQLHTHHHTVPRDEALFAREITENRDHIGSITGRRAEHFCYPCGEHFPECLPRLAALGVRSATTTEPGLVDSAAHPFLLPRYLDHQEVHEVEFDAWLAGVDARLPGRKRNPSIVDRLGE